MSETGNAGWHPDPGGRHQLRYYDGRQWTDHVADNGVTSTEPLGAAAAAPTRDALNQAGEAVSEAADAVAGAAKRAWAAIKQQPPAGEGEPAAAESTHRDDLVTLQDLRARGILTDEEFEAARGRLPGPQ